MGIDYNDTTEDGSLEQGSEQEFDFWSDEGARRLNEALDEGSAYALAGVHLTEDFEAHLEDGQPEYLYPKVDDRDEENLPPGEMEIIFENCFIM